MKKETKDYLCLALDLDDKQEILAIVRELKDLVGYFKLNYTYTKYGPDIIKDIKNLGGKVFLDLKFHDIPNTIEGYARTATALNIDIFNVHASGGKEMMAAAVKGAKEEAKKNNIEKPLILAVTILTSIDQEIMNNEINMQGDIDSQVLNLAKISKESGMDGIVCSAADLEKIKKELPENFFFLTPGIKGATIGSDQKRIYTPKKAISEGSSLLVLGRGILKASNRREEARKVLQLIEEGLKNKN